MIFIVVLGIAIFIPLMSWIISTKLSFSAGKRERRRGMALFSTLLSGLAALAVCMASVIDDFNDYPGYTCLERRTPELEELAANWYLPPDAGPDHSVSDLQYSHKYEIFPVGMECTTWPPGHPELAVVTHSHWLYTLFFYALMTLAFIQAIRVVRPGTGPSDEEVKTVPESDERSP